MASYKPACELQARLFLASYKPACELRARLFLAAMCLAVHTHHIPLTHNVPHHHTQTPTHTLHFTTQHIPTPGSSPYAWLKPTPGSSPHTQHTPTHITHSSHTQQITTHKPHSLASHSRITTHNRPSISLWPSSVFRLLPFFKHRHGCILGAP